MRSMFLALVLSLLPAACATTQPAPDVETVGALSASYHSIAVAPVHAGTDLAVGYQAVSADADDVPVTVGAGEAVEAPEVAAKAGLTMGTVR